MPTSPSPMAKWPKRPRISAITALISCGDQDGEAAHCVDRRASFAGFWPTRPCARSPGWRAAWPRCGPRHLTAKRYRVRILAHRLLHHSAPFHSSLASETRHEKANVVTKLTALLSQDPYTLPLGAEF